MLYRCVHVHINLRGGTLYHWEWWPLGICSIPGIMRAFALGLLNNSEDWLLYTRHCAEHLMDMISPHPHDPRMWMLWLSLAYRWENWSPERSCTWSRSHSSLIGHWARNQNPGSLVPEPDPLGEDGTFTLIVSVFSRSEPSDPGH